VDAQERSSQNAVTLCKEQWKHASNLKESLQNNIGEFLQHKKASSHDSDNRYTMQKLLLKSKRIA
jgi:hypothetical protein